RCAIGSSRASAVSCVYRISPGCGGPRKKTGCAWESRLCLSKPLGHLIARHLESTELRLTITPQETEAGMAQLVFVDLETTGLEVERHGIIEIACIFENDGTREAAGLHSMVNPGDVEHTEGAAAVHNI